MTSAPQESDSTTDWTHRTTRDCTSSFDLSRCLLFPFIFVSLSRRSWRVFLFFFWGLCGVEARLYCQESWLSGAELELRLPRPGGKNDPPLKYLLAIFRWMIWARFRKLIPLNICLHARVDAKMEWILNEQRLPLGLRWVKQNKSCAVKFMGESLNHRGAFSRKPRKMDARRRLAWTDTLFVPFKLFPYEVPTSLFKRPTEI